MEKIKVVIDKDIESLIPEFLEAREKDVHDIPCLLKDKKYSEIITIGHGMRGSGGGYGFDEITRIGEAIENAGRLKKDEEILREVSKLETYLHSLEIVYEE